MLLRIVQLAVFVWTGEGLIGYSLQEIMKNIVIFILKMIVAVALVWWILEKGHLDVRSLRRVLSPSLIFLGFVLVGVNVLINNYRWLQLLRSQGIAGTVGSTLPLTFVGLFFNTAVPGGVGGDVVKAYYFLRLAPNKRMAATVCIFLDRYIGMFSLVLLAVFALVGQGIFWNAEGPLGALVRGIFLLLVVFLASFVVLFSRMGSFVYGIALKFVFIPGHGKLMSLLENILTFRSQPLVLFRALGLSLVSQSFTLSVFVILGWVLDPTIPFWVFPFAGSVGLIATAFPISPASIGVGQAIFFFLFQWALGRPSEVGATLATVQQLITILLAAIGAVIYVKMKRHPEAAPQPEAYQTSDDKVFEKANLLQ